MGRKPITEEEEEMNSVVQKVTPMMK